jgi:hypothetical protein
VEEAGACAASADSKSLSRVRTEATEAMPGAQEGSCRACCIPARASPPPAELLELELELELELLPLELPLEPPVLPLPAPEEADRGQQNSCSCSPEVKASRAQEPCCCRDSLPSAPSMPSS